MFELTLDNGVQAVAEKVSFDRCKPVIPMIGEDLSDQCSTARSI